MDRDIYFLELLLQVAKQTDYLNPEKEFVLRYNSADKRFEVKYAAVVYSYSSLNECFQNLRASLAENYLLSVLHNDDCSF